MKRVFTEAQEGRSRGGMHQVLETAEELEDDEE